MCVCVCVCVLHGDALENQLFEMQLSGREREGGRGGKRERLVVPGTSTTARERERKIDGGRNGAGRGEMEIKGGHEGKGV